MVRRAVWPAWRGNKTVVASLLALLALPACDRPNTTSESDSVPVAVHTVDPEAGGTVDGGGLAAAAVAPDAWQRPPLPELPPPPDPPSAEEAGTCPKKRDADGSLGILISPRRPSAGRPVRVLASTLAGEDALAVRIEAADGRILDVERRLRRGTPAATIVEFTPQETGNLKIVVGREGQGLRCQDLAVRSSPARNVAPDVDATSEPVAWEIRRRWSSAEEALYSAWVRELFHGDSGEDLAWSKLDEVTSDRERNLLHGYFGWREDSKSAGLKLIPDCADTPYFLRAYFAWKRGLPFGFMKCSRGRGQAPRCFSLRTNAQRADLSPVWTREEEPESLDRVKLVQRFFSRTLAWGVHTGNGRVAHSDPRNDFYPVTIGREGLRPGVIYADPYGHILVIVDLVEGGAGRPGILFAIDGQPDGSITRKRFWEGNFLWNPDPTLGGSGFKAFRPIVETGKDPASGRKLLAQVENRGLEGFSVYEDFSTAQGQLSADEFYDTVERVISPQARDAFLAQEEAVAALAEAARVRVTSVDNGVGWVAEHPGKEIDMPRGHAIFETQGAWENFSTPARDLRLLIAMDVVAGFDAKLRRQPEAFGFADRAEVERAAQALARERKRLLASEENGIRYRRSDGSEWSLTLADLMDRQTRLEVAYNPNDCTEVRWGAPAGSEEHATCNRHSSDGQQAMMEAYRPWFRDRQRPGRGDLGPEIPGVTDM